MVVDTYNESLHYHAISHWYRERNMAFIPRQSLPKIGYVVAGVAAGFLYQTDSNIAMIENLISNPTSDKKTRNKALDLILGTLLKKAAELKYLLVVGFADSDVVVKRCLKLGFAKANKPFSLVSKGVGLWAS